MSSDVRAQTEAHQESSVIHASCYCGAASYKVEGKPYFSLYCHCTQCQRIHGSPFVLVLHYPSKAVAWTHTDPDAVFTKSKAEDEWKEWRCKSCLGILGSENSSRQRWSLKGALFCRNTQGLIENWHLVKPTGHMFYDTRMLDVNDGLPKWESYAGASRRIDSDVRS
ncbi:hypothetical protein AN958_12824 [Leucoagaricus sp. SymC.cos]|nr:hypothetical protein AN958_12824 [Leucoagaricus sp. SymC.cos]